jgi:ribosomal protein S18 acetylase RimI-like enzyme
LNLNSKFAKYEPNIIPRSPLKNVIYRSAQKNDSEEIAKITFQRENNSKKYDLNHYVEKSKKEINSLETNDKLYLFVAEYNKQIIGFGRIKYYNNPSRWFLMGVIVSPNFRRMGIGKNLTIERLKFIKKKSNEIFYIVNAQNKVSIALHEKLGFKKIDEASTFLNVKFDGDKGFLFQYEINNLLY